MRSRVSLGAPFSRVSAALRRTAALVLVLGLPVAAHAQSLQETIEPGSRVGGAARTELPPAIDGRVVEEAWSAATALTDFVQHSPFDGEAPSEPTEVMILYDDEALYIGARLYDSRPDAIVTGESRRDASLEDRDAFRVVLDTYLDRQNAFVFATSPTAIEYDGQVMREGSGGFGGGRQQAGSGGGFNLNWDGSWQVATSVDSAGWYAEFRIPFSTLRYVGGGEQVWGLNFARHIRRHNEQSFWSPVPRQFDLYRISDAGYLEGLEPPTRRTLTLTPYVLGSAQRDYRAPAEETDYPLEVGGDAKIGITQSLTLDLTYNTDFAQVEVDEQQVNLTRFNLFFPEKRPFFLENAGLFSVGTPQDVELFFSRRIGLGPEGQPVPIVGGGRLSGRAAGFGVGLMNIQTAAADGIQPANNYTVARVLRELPNRSRVGGLFVNRFSPDLSGDYNRTYALDGRLGIGDAVTLDGYAAATETPGLGGRDHAFALQSSYSTRDWSGNLNYREVGGAFNPEVGFLTRSGYRYVRAFVMNFIRFGSGHWLRELRPHVSYDGHYDFDGFQETGTIHIDSHVEFPNGAFFSPAFDLTREGLREPFEIADGVVVPEGTYDNVIAAWRVNTDESAALSLNANVNVGGFLSGERRGGAVGVTARRGGSLNTTFRVSHDRVTLPEGAFNVTLATLRAAYAFTPRIYLQSLVQYNDQADNWSGNIRFGWLSTAGTGLFVVYNEQQRLERPRGPLDRALIVKYAHRFDIGR